MVKDVRGDCFSGKNGIPLLHYGTQGCNRTDHGSRCVDLFPGRGPDYCLGSCRAYRRLYPFARHCRSIRSHSGRFGRCAGGGVPPTGGRTSAAVCGRPVRVLRFTLCCCRRGVDPPPRNGGTGAVDHSGQRSAGRNARTGYRYGKRRHCRGFGAQPAACRGGCGGYIV